MDGCGIDGELVPIMFMVSCSWELSEKRRLHWLAHGGRDRIRRLEFAHTDWIKHIFWQRNGTDHYLCEGILRLSPIPTVA